ncbi:MAG: DNA/RNA non-specific endonuclease, partial [Bacteroidales bacterium]|nr:DNA/RNA non-specific endonuclease [Bacteroidales bacterium]MDY5206750.1 DNA/RNA non-specific endonuclease [Sodaliphilus sp.]
MKKLSYSIIALLLSAGIVCFAVKFTAGQTADAEVPNVENVEKKSPVGKLVSTDKNPLLLVKVPQDVANQRINHMAYVCYFNKEHRIPNCVIYELSATEVAQCDAPGAERRKNYKFLADPKCPDSPEWYEYRGSGYDRGHMVPANDMKWNKTAMKECFYMTNMCPQLHALNDG